MTTNKWFYTQEEVELIKSIKPEWGKMGKQFKRVAQELGRSAQAIQFQYYLLNQTDSKLTELKPRQPRTPKIMTRQSNIEAAFDSIKDYVQGMEAENARLRKQLDDLQEEFDQVLGIINKARQISTQTDKNIRYRQNRDGSIDMI